VIVVTRADTEQYSSACVRAALTALSIAAVVWLLNGTLDNRASTQALADYVNLRTDLADAINDVDADDCWSYTKTLLGSRIEADWPLRKVANFECGQTDADVRDFHAAPTPATVPATAPSSKISFRPGRWSFTSPPPPFRAPIDAVRGLPPPAPSGLRVTAPLYPVFDLLAALKSLSDPAVTNSAAATSNPIRASLRQWVRLQYRLVNARSFHPIFPYPYVVSVKGSPPPEQSQADREKMLELFTLADAKRLSAYNAISPEQFDTVSAEIGRMKIPGMDYYLRLDTAACAIEAVLFLSVFWFWLNFRELVVARESDASIPTLLSLFSRTIGTKAVFCVLTAFVALSSAFLAFKSGLYILWGVGFVNVWLCRRIISLTSWIRY